MVKFGLHQQAFLENELRDSELYTVPYNDVKWGCIPTQEHPDACADKFVDEWRQCLEKCCNDFKESSRAFWKIVFEGICSLPESRGALPDTALNLYLSVSEEGKIQELHTLLKDVHATALLNSEALRKLVKKYDKSCGGGDCSTFLSPRLLPEVYAANFTMGQETLEAGLAVFRAHLGLDEEDDVDEADEETISRIRSLTVDGEEEMLHGGSKNKTTGSSFYKKKNSDAELVDKRSSELKWLSEFTSSMDPSLIGKLVGHRGFHNIKDRSDRRPIENSLMAYEAAWTNGIHLCECDIALTKDEKLILAHDEDFSRLALDRTSPQTKKKVRDLTFKEIIALPLKSGARPPLLFDVLRSAHAIGGCAQMIVEIKPGNVDAGTALARLFARHPDLMERCAVVMSFDAFAMHKFRKELAHVLLEQQKIAAATAKSPESKPAHRHQRTLSSASVMIPTAMSIGANLGETPMPGHHHRVDSTDHFGLGMSLTRMDSFQFQLFQAGDRKNSFGKQQQPRGSITANTENLATIPSHKPKVEPLTPSSTIATEGIYRPKLLLITVCETPKRECELQTDVSDFSRIDSWLQGGDIGCLDGVYLQFQPEMLEPPGLDAMKDLTERYDVGIWGANPKPDDFSTFHRLVTECGVSYVNSGLPRKFMKNK